MLRNCGCVYCEQFMPNIILNMDEAARAGSAGLYL